MIQRRGAELIEISGASSAASAASAVRDAVRTIVAGTDPGDWTTCSIDPSTSSNRSGDLAMKLADAG